jgi:hypothetical protein
LHPSEYYFDIILNAFRVNFVANTIANTNTNTANTNTTDITNIVALGSWRASPTVPALIFGRRE